MRIGDFVSWHSCVDSTTSLKSKSKSKTSSGAGLGAGLVVALILLFSTGVLAESAADIYKARCSACHGVHGAGDTMLGRNLKLRPLDSAEVQMQSDDELYTIISKGKGRDRMPAFDRKLSKEQIADLVRYIRSLKK
jgi:mono/diheme cytochrome c family protein